MYLFGVCLFPKKHGVFELLLLRNAQKRHEKKKGTYVPRLVAICQIYAAFKKAFGAPSPLPWRLWLWGCDFFCLRLQAPGIGPQRNGQCAGIFHAPPADPVGA
jgi:hypothetical protein